jgi:nicotinamidase-related amidase
VSSASSLIDEPSLTDSALLLNDLINANLRRRDDPQHNATIAGNGFVANALRIVAGLRPFRVPVFWVRVARRPDRADVPDNLVDVETAWHTSRTPISEGSFEAAFLEEVAIAAEDQVIVKTRIDPFLGTNLDLELRTRGVRTLAVGGYATNVGVEACARTAHDLGYNVVVLRDCCWNIAAAAHLASLEHNLPLFARVLTGDEWLAEVSTR